MSLNAPYTPNTVIQSTQVSNDLVGLANGTNDTTNNSMSTYRGEVVFDHVTSGCVWSGDSYGVSRNGSQTSGVVYISGVRLPVSAVSAHLFTASKDTYIDINGSGVQVYTEATNNAASPALTAGSVRIGIIITGATTIAAATSVNQGQETMVLPIASSIPYAVTDSLGNLICPRDPNRKVLGFRQTLSAFTLSASQTTPTQITGLTCPVIVPTGRKVKVVVSAVYTSNVTANQSSAMQIWDGVVNSGTKLNETSATNATGNGLNPAYVDIEVTPSATSKTYNAGIVSGGLSNVVVGAGAATPAFIRVELA